MRRTFALLLSPFLLLALGGSCQPGGEVRILTPSDASVVGNFAFTVEIELEPDAVDAETLEVTLNGAPLSMAGGPTIFTADLVPGAPLRDANELRARARVAESFVWAQAVSHFDYLPPKARARRIVDPADRLTGPLAHSRVGDWLLENDVARFVVQDVGQRDMWSVGQFGGNLIDAELVARPGTDNFLELQPGVNIETVINAQTAEILNDGQDGAAAIVETCGPDDLLDFINPSTNLREFGFEPPEAADDVDHQVEGCTRYVLEPGASHVRLETTIDNGESQDLPLFVGDFLNAAGAVEPWSVSAPVSLVENVGIGEALTGSLTSFAYLGFGAATGLAYAFVPIPSPGATLDTDFLTAAGVTVTLQNASIAAILLFDQPAPFVVPAGGTRTFSRVFGVGDGSRNDAVALELETLEQPSGYMHGCVTVGGEPAPGARVSLVEVNQGEIGDLRSHFVADGTGCYAGAVPVGDFHAAAARNGAPYEGGAAAPPLHPVSFADGGEVELDFALPGSGTLRVEVRDADALALPARVTVVGFDPSPEPRIEAAGVLPDVLGQAFATGLFRDIGKDDLPFGVVAIDYAGSDGVAELEVEPGTYQVYVSRGFEYSLYDERVTIVAGTTAELDATIARVLDTTGYVSSDFHVHAVMSADSTVSRTRRAMQYAGEGVDNIVMTEHNARHDLRPTIQSLGLTPFVTATVGEEITTWDYGHFNGYPYTVDPDRVSGGSLDWGGAEPPGQDFPAYGAYILTPAELDAKGTTGPGTTASSVVQINHIGSTFEPLRIDTSQVPPQAVLSADEKRAMRIDPSTGDLFHHFKAMEIVNGDSRGAQNGFFNNDVGVWFNLLNQGLATTGTGVSDSHGYRNLNAAGARTFTPSPTDAPAAIDPLDVGASIRDGRAVVSMGPFVHVALRATDGSGGLASHDHGGATQVASTDGGVELDVHVQAAAFSPFDEIRVYRNQGTIPSVVRDGVPVRFRSEPPEVTLRAGVDFAVVPVEVDPSVPGASRLESEVTVPFPALDEDSWFVVVVKGNDGVSRPLFPVIADDLASGSNATLADLVDGNLGESGVPALAITNALYADLDGVPGFQPPNGP